MTHARTESFHGDDAQYERLRQAVTWLHSKGTTSARLAQLAKLNCDYTVLDKFRRRDGTKRIKYEQAAHLWHYIALHRPEAPGIHDDTQAAPPSDDGAAFFNAFVKYFDVHKYKTTDRAAHLTGRYRFYQYSEEFNGYDPELPCAIVLGEFRITAEGGVVSVIETQGYDGKLGKIGMTETYSGYCFPKGHEYYFLMKETTRDTPKFVVFYDAHHEGTPQRVRFMKGYMLKGSYDDTYFHSPVYALRDDDGDFACNIFRPADIPASILAELNKQPLSLLTYAQARPTAAP